MTAPRPRTAGTTDPGTRRPSSPGGGSRGPRRPRPDAARLAALDTVRAVADRGAYANLVLPGLLRERRLSTQDAGFATELAYGTLRAQGTLDLVLARCADRSLDRLDPAVLALVQLGAFQLLRMRVPTHAAVSATVDLARYTVGPGRAGFVNAVLRRVSERTPEAWLDELAPPYDEDPVGHLAVVHAHPRWVVSAFRDALGGSLAETGALLAVDDAPAGSHLVARPGRIGRDELLASAGPEAVPAPWSPYGVHLRRGDPGGLAAVRDGRAGVQDEGSQLCALALAAAPLAGPDARWLDLAAGPGGKAAVLAGLAGERGATLLAAEKAPHRARLVARTLGRSAATVIADSTVPAWTDGGFDRVLLDAPCTGLGALRRRPEARWRRTPADVPGVARLQRDLLASALRAVRPGGLVAYVVCSPHLAETAVPVAGAVRAGGVELVDARPLLPGVPALGDGPTVQLWPHRQGTDAMHLALLRRTPGPTPH